MKKFNLLNQIITILLLLIVTLNECILDGEGIEIKYLDGKFPFFIINTTLYMSFLIYLGCSVLSLILLIMSKKAFFFMSIVKIILMVYVIYLLSGWTLDTYYIQNNLPQFLCTILFIAVIAISTIVSTIINLKYKLKN